MEKWAAPAGRRGQSLTLISSNMSLLFGGVTSGGKVSSGGKYSAAMFKLVFNPVHWEVVEAGGSKPSARAFHTSNLVDDTKLIIFGGRLILIVMAMMTARALPHTHPTCYCRRGACW